jgi:hypothetical protein
LKVIRVSCHDHEDWRGNERQMTRAGLDQVTAELVCSELQQNPDRSDDDRYRAVADDHELWKFKP